MFDILWPIPLWMSQLLSFNKHVLRKSNGSVVLYWAIIEYDVSYKHMIIFKQYKWFKSNGYLKIICDYYEKFEGWKKRKKNCDPLS